MDHKARRTGTGLVGAAQLWLLAFNPLKKLYGRLNGSGQPPAAIISPLVRTKVQDYFRSLQEHGTAKKPHQEAPITLRQQIQMTSMNHKARRTGTTLVRVAQPWLLAFDPLKRLCMVVLTPGTTTRLIISLLVRTKVQDYFRSLQEHGTAKKPHQEAPITLRQQIQMTSMNHKARRTGTAW